MKKNIFSFFVLFFFLGISVLGSNFVQNEKKYSGIPIAHADDEGDYEQEDHYEKGDNSNYSPSSSIKIEKAKPIYKTILVPVVKITLDPIFTIDSDGDGLFDGIDPHPKMHEKEYFTDDDGDGIANAFDMHKGEDDYTYYDQETDVNGNGIIDSYEDLGNR